MQRSEPQFGPTDALVLLVLAVGLVVAGWWISVAYEYKWNWAAVPARIVWRGAEGGWHVGPLLYGLFYTIRISIWTTLVALVLGLFLGLMRLSRTLFWRLVSGSYVQIVRNLPPLVLILFMYFLVFGFLERRMGFMDGLQYRVSLLEGAGAGIARVLFGRTRFLGRFLCAVITLGLYEGAYVTEIIRAGVEGIPKGQFEAAHALGLTRVQELRHVILPQALRNVLPALTGQFISAIKASAIVSIIAVPELTFRGDEVAASVGIGMEMWITVAAMYLGLTLSCSMALHALERRLTRHRA